VVTVTCLYDACEQLGKNTLWLLQNTNDLLSLWGVEHGRFCIFNSVYMPNMYFVSAPINSSHVITTRLINSRAWMSHHSVFKLLQKVRRFFYKSVFQRDPAYTAPLRNRFRVDFEMKKITITLFSTYTRF